MIEFVRASTEVGHVTMSRAQAEATGAKILDREDAVDSVGKPLPPKPKAELTKSASAEKGA